ncbi:MAG: hypothetical protein IIZ97_04285 [Prevotella sp.]|nr:hypothetical protein [Prevotella sp.]
MKKTYLKPLSEVIELKGQVVMDGSSGPGFNDSKDLPNVTGDGDDGPGAGDYGDTPNRSNYNQFDEWEDEE